jgi:hypothetical protein
VAAEHGSKCHAWPPTYHFERLLEAACLNHAYPHQAQAQLMRHDETFHDLGGSHQVQGARRIAEQKGCATLPREQAVMASYGGHPPPPHQGRRASNESPGTPAHCSQGPELGHVMLARIHPRPKSLRCQELGLWPQERRDIGNTIFYYMYVFISIQRRNRKKNDKQDGLAHERASRLASSPRDWRQRHGPPAGAPGRCPSCVKLLQLRQQVLPVDGI